MYLAQQFTTPNTLVDFDVRYVTVFGYELGMSSLANAMFYADSSDAFVGNLSTQSGMLAELALPTQGEEISSQTGEFAQGSLVLTPNTKYWLVMLAKKVIPFNTSYFVWNATTTVGANDGLFWRTNFDGTSKEVLSTTDNRNGAFRLISYDLSAITPDYDLAVRSKKYYV